MADKFYLTTPIYYVNARPHIGHAYTTIVADVLARRHRLLGDDTYFLTGTDEHGQKIERSAAAAGIPPQQFADQVSASFETLWKRMGITNDDYIRTTDPRHARGVQKLFADLHAKGQIYLSSYTGQYSIGEEMFVDGPPGTIGPDGRPTETVTEENFFFRLSDYQERLRDLIESDTLKITPESRKNEVLSFVNSGLKDLSVSRSSFTWGIPVPEPAASEAKEKHVIYVWLDALANYMTAVGYGSDSPADQEKFAKYWPADLHLVGKEIIRFHCVYWPAFLMAAGLPLPKAITAHGWLLFDDSKMSKSKGNIVRTETILDAFGTLCPTPPPSGPASLPSRSSSGLQPAETGKAEEGALAPAQLKHHQDLFAADILRYFLLREIPFGQDGSFSFDALITRYNADLANGYGNLVSRTLSMVRQYFSSTNAEGRPGGTAEIPDMPGLVVRSKSSSLSSMFGGGVEYIKELDFQRALEETMRFVGASDNFITTTAPWKLAKADTEAAAHELITVLYTACEAIRIITILLHPILPYATTSVWQQLGLSATELLTPNSKISTLKWGALPPGTKLGPLSPIFPRADKGLATIMANMESPDLSAITTNADATHPASDDLPTAPIASKLVDESFVQAPIPATTFDPAAGPRTTTLAEPNPGTQVAGSAAHTTGPDPSLAASTNYQPPTTNSISIDDFIKIDLRVAKIIVAERIPKADKLLRLEVDLGYETRQILSGIAEYYTPEELLGRRIVIIANLAPRKMRGLESHGMLLAASAEGGKPILATFPEAEELPLGSQLK